MSQEEYGGPELVPSGLRVYRHYKLTGYHLRATVTTDEAIEPGVNVAKCYANPGGNPFRPYGGGCVKCGGYGFLRRMRPKVKPFQFSADLSSPETIDVEIYDEECQCQRGRAKCRTPEVHCTCGFYASYDPALNFFADSIQNGFGWMYNLPTIRAVVEASGRVLMGSKGVRAEKMEVKAIALDMSHILHADRYARLREFYEERDAWSYDSISSALSAALSRPSGRQLYELESVAARYRIPSFGADIDAMVREFPQPDISGLIENQEK